MTGQITFRTVTGGGVADVISPKMALHQAYIQYLVLLEQRMGPMEVVLDDGEGNQWTWRPAGAQDLFVGMAIGLSAHRRSP